MRSRDPVAWAVLAALVLTLPSFVGPVWGRSLVIRPSLPAKPRPGPGNYVFGLASGPPWSAEFSLAGEFSALASRDLEEGPHGEAGPRLAPLVTEGGSRTIADLLTNPTTDLAMIPVPSLALAARERPNLPSRIAYVAPLYLQKAHVLAGNAVQDVEGLRGRRVVLGPRGGVGFILFQALGVEVEVVDLPVDVALSRVGTAEVDAVVLMSGGAVPVLSDLDPGRGLHLLPIPYASALQADFLPTEMSRADYPNLIGPASIPSVATQIVLAAYRWPSRSERAQSLATLVTGLLNHVGDLGPDGRGRLLQDVNWAATLPGWTRLDAAQRWLQAHAKPDRGNLVDETDRTGKERQ